MSRKINKILGLGAIAAFGFASSAFAQCPSSPVPPWSTQSASAGTVAIAAGGFDGTSCRLDASLTAPLPSAAAFVRDNTPASEPRYRAQFLVNVDALTGLNSLQSVQIFNAATDTPVSGNANLVQLFVTGNLPGTAKALGIATACSNNASGRCTSTTSLPGTGVHRIEIDWDKAANSLKIWVNNTTEATPTATVSANNTAWSGVDYAVLGLAFPNAGFRTGQLNRAVQFDEFDSRRSTFIGN